MTLAGDALAEVTALVDQWLLKWGKLVKFDNTESDDDLQDVWTQVCEATAAFSTFGQSESESRRELERWHEQKCLSDESQADSFAPHLPPSWQTSTSLNSFERLPAEILQMIFEKAIPEWEEQSFKLLCLSKSLYPIAQRALYHTPPTLCNIQDALALLRKFQICPGTAIFVRHLRYAIPSQNLGLLERLSIFRALSKCTCLSTLTVFSDLTNLFDDMHAFDGYSLLKRKTTLSELQILDDCGQQPAKLIQCLRRLRTLNVFDPYCYDISKIWYSQPPEHYMSAVNALVPTSVDLPDSADTSIRPPAELVFPSNLQDLRMLVEDFYGTEPESSFVLEVLTNTIQRNEPLPALRLLELFIVNQPLDTLLFPILQSCKGSLQILRISLITQLDRGVLYSEPDPLSLTDKFYNLVAQISGLRLLELRQFPLERWEFPCTGPFTSSIQVLAINACFGNGLTPDMLYDTAIRFKDTLRMLYLVKLPIEDYEKETLVKNLTDAGMTLKLKL
ncbi:hypothetical protein BT69DRAFT_1330928 [Atractiella rhizophila]|nr:hypothetical protein BT69DRAFT_1330928 [Atractiella rhizophila]